jgi:hypothetical protein
MTGLYIVSVSSRVALAANNFFEKNCERLAGCKALVRFGI